MIDIETLLDHYPDLTVGEYFLLFNPEPKPKLQSELSKQVEIQVLTYQSSINEMRGCEDKKIVVKPLISVHIKKQVTKFRTANY